MNSNRHQTYLNWSTGKDAALALYYLKQNPDFDVTHLLTAINSHHDRVSMHGLHRSLYLKQVQEIGLSFSTVELPENPSMKEYETSMSEAVLSLKSQGYEFAAFGDLFLEDLKKYRIEKLNSIAMNTVFPLWKKNTKELISEFVDLGFKAIVVSMNSNFLDKSFCGRIIDQNFLSDLPANVDPCGENGEFHTFCFDGPIFKNPIKFIKGENTYKEYDDPVQPTSKIGFWFCDLIIDD